MADRIDHDQHYRDVPLPLPPRGDSSPHRGRGLPLSRSRALGLDLHDGLHASVEAPSQLEFQASADLVL